MSLTRENYYDLGSLEDLILSNSALSAINPHQGGSFPKFMDFFNEEKERKETLSLVRGTLFHYYMEVGEDVFAVNTVEIPSAKLGDATKKVIEVMKENDDISWSDFTDADLLEIADSVDYGTSWKNETVVNKIRDGLSDYMEEWEENKGKKTITLQDKEILDQCIKSINGNTDYLELLEKFDLAYYKEEREYPILFELEGYKMKGLLDRLFYKYDEKENSLHICVIDYKTTGRPISQYMGHLTPVLDDKSQIRYAWSHSSSYLNFRTYRQLGLYTYGISTLLGKEYNVGREKIHLEAYVVGVETMGFFESRVIPISGSHLFTGVTEAKTIINKSVKAYENWRLRDKQTDTL